MKDRYERRIMLQWLIPGAILLGILLILLIRFSVTSRLTEQQEVVDGLQDVTESYAQQIESTMDSIWKSTDLVASYVAQTGRENLDISALLHSVCNAAGVYDAVVCDADGNGIRPSGEEIKLGESDYFAHVKSGGKQILYVTDDGIAGGDALIAVSPIDVDGIREGYVLGYYEPVDLSALLKRLNLGTGACFVLIDQSGRVVTTAGNRESSFAEKTTDYFAFLKQDEENEESVTRMYTLIQNDISGICYVTLKGESKAIVYVPMKNQKFYLLTCVSQKYINQAVMREWASMQSIVWQVIILMMVFAGIVIVMNILTRIRDNEKSREMADKADTDLLTDLYNKAATERRIKDYLAAHPDQMGLLFVLDIDNFKKINDTMGHAFGDEVLHTFGIQIRAEFRATDILGRTGGDEFTIFLCNMKEESIIRTEAKRLERFFQNFQAGEYVKYSATASIGAAIYPQDGKDFESLYKAADSALYVAKKRGKNQLAFYGDDK